MDWIKQYRIVNKLKSVYRLNSNENRKESVAEHCWGCLMLAEQVLPAVKEPLNKERIMQLIYFHDLVEIHAGDTRLSPDPKIAGDFNSQKERQQQSAIKLVEELPTDLKKTFQECYEELSKNETRESKFVIAIDAIEPIIHELDYPEDWKGWSEKFLRDKKQKKIEEFPELVPYFEQILKFMRENVISTNRKVYKAIP